MKTPLPKEIKTVEQAKEFLKSLHENGEDYHPEDDAFEVVWNMPEQDTPNEQERDQLNKLMEDIYNLPGNDGGHDNSIAFDPCSYLLELELRMDGTGYEPYNEHEHEN